MAIGRILGGTLIGATSVLGTLSYFTSREQNQPVKVARASDEMPYGVSRAVWEQVRRDPVLHDWLLSMPEEAVSLYNQRNLSEKKSLLKETKGKEACFISGERYVWFFIEQKIQSAKLTRAEAKKAQEALKIVRSLASEQRRVLLVLLRLEREEDQNRKGPEKSQHVFSHAE